MPRSKRARIVHLSKVEKKGKALTLKTFANIQECVGRYPYLYIFSVDNMRNTYLKDVRSQLSDSRLFFGKTKVMAKALGSDPSTAAGPNTHLLSPHIHGTVGLLFTPRTPSTILSYFSNFHPADFARAGSIASRDFTIPAGTIMSTAGEISAEEDVPLAPGLEPGLRKLGVPSRLVKGKVELESDYPVCREGEVLGSGQTTLLKMFGMACSEFGVEVQAYWTAETGEVTVVKENIGAPGQEMELDGREDSAEGGNEE